MLQHEIKSVMFDLAGTLCSLSDLKLPFNSFLKDFVRNFGKDASDQEVEVNYALALMRSFQTVGQKDFYLHRDLFSVAIKNFLELMDIDSSQDEDIDFALKNQRELTINSIRVREGVHETILTLKDMDIITAVVSNIDEDYFYPMLEKLEIKDKVDVCLSSEKANSCKPDMKIFRTALDLVNNCGDFKSDITSSQTLFVGDTPFADIKGANQASMKSVLLKTGAMKAVSNLTGESKPDFMIAKISEVLKLCSSAADNN